jgi:hypothetical protein
VQEFSYADGVLTPARTFNLPAVSGQSFAGGLAVSPDGKMLYVTRVFAQTLSTIDLSSGQLVKTVSLTAEPYNCVVSADGKLLYVSLWGGSAVSVFDAQSLTAVNHFDTGEHPSAMVFSADSSACSSPAATARASGQRTVTGRAIEEISMTLFPDAPRTATPNARPGAGWEDAARRQRGRQHGRGCRHQQQHQQFRQWLHSDRVVPHGRALCPRRQAVIRLERKRPRALA